MENIKITYLLNSGFMVQIGELLFLFDDYADPAAKVKDALAASGFSRLYVFVSHAHFDHFDTHILDYAGKARNYIMSNEIKNTKRGKLFPADKTVYLPEYSEWADDAITVRSFSSTDTGTSFFVLAKGRKIFHAGDFNWWHWINDTRENQMLAKNAFMKQMKKLTGLSADVSFFPIDGRLGAAQDMGAKEFCRRTITKSIVAMHNVGFAPWKPAEDFFAEGREIPYWSPAAPGESMIFSEGKFEKN